jgi:hypothetical protein
MQSRECRLCHRIGYLRFVPSGDYGWVCYHETPCLRRAVKRANPATEARRAHDTTDREKEN